MKHTLLSITLIALLIAGFSSCKSNDVENAAKKFLTAMAHMDFEVAKQYGTKETGAIVNLFAQFSQQYPDSVKSASKKISVDIKGVKEEGNKAVVTYVSSDDPAERTLDMVKEDGEWKAQISKSNPSGATNTVAPGEPATDPAMDTMTAEPVDIKDMPKDTSALR